MRSFLTFFTSAFKSLERKRASLQDEALLALELIYLRALQNKKPTLKDAISSTHKTIQAHIFLPEFVFLVGGIVLISYSSGVFMEQRVEYGAIRPVLYAISSIFAILISIALAYVTTPFHLLCGVNIWLLRGAHVLLAALIFSTLQPFFPALLLEEGIADFGRLFFPVLIFFGLAEFYMLFRLNTFINFKYCQARHAAPDIESEIPRQIQGALVSMSSQDHYLEITTENGSHLSRQTMAKAISLVPENTGLRVHRSHWVAYASIVDMEKSGDKYSILLKNGKKIPVGKTKVADVRAFLDGR